MGWMTLSMIILLLLLWQLVALTRSTQDKKVYLIVGASSFWTVCWLFLLHFELLSMGVTTYGSDESGYFYMMTTAYNSDNWLEVVDSYFNSTYVLLGTIILKTSFFPSILLIRICNVLLLLNTIVLFYKVATRFLNLKAKTVYAGMLLISFNGLITWTAIRNLKDMLFIYLLMIFIYLVLDMYHNKKWSLLRIGVLAGAYYVLTDIRQWFVYLVILLAVVVIAVQLYKRKRYLLFLVVTVASAGYAISYLQKGLTTLMTYTVTYSEFASDVLGGDAITGKINGSLLSLPMSMARFIIGPGPIRALFGGEAFVASTTTGNVLIFLGGLMWWCFLPLFFLSLLSLKHFKKSYALLIFILFYWMMYAYAYDGSGDTRLRAVLYILCIMYTLPFLVNHWKPAYYPRFVLVFFPLILLGSYFSYLSLA